MKLKLPELQDNDKKSRKLRVEKLAKGQKNIEKGFYY